jgi:hypothetical protein
MATETAGDTSTETTETGFDMEAASDRLGASLFPETSTTEPEEDAPNETPEPVAAAPDPLLVPTDTQVQPADLPPAPKSWPKEMHAHWTKVPKEVQDYISNVREKQILDGIEQYKQAASYGKTLNDVLAPYQPLLQSKGLDAPRAVADLMQAYTALTQGTPEQRRDAFLKMGKNLNIPMGTEATPATPVDPEVQQLKEQFQQMQSHLTAQQQEAFNAARSKAMSEIETFAADASHAYFEELQDDILGFLKLGDSLQGAYEKAVWANPVTRAKEIARTQTETETKLKENARLQALPKKQAKSVNIGGRDTQRVPTDPLGSMDDTLKATAMALRSRVAH